MVGDYEIAGASVQVADALAVMDTYADGLPPGLQKQLRQAIRLFRWGPLLCTGRPRPFTRLSLEDQDSYIRTWAESHFRLRRRIFRTLRDLIFLGYYSQAGPREMIGYREDRHDERGR